MHQPRHPHALQSLRVGSALLLLTLSLALLAGLAMVAGFWLENKKLLIAALCILATSGLVLVFFRAVASSARCPLCFCPVLLPKEHACHRDSLTLFGSHRIRVMTDILARGDFRCPYCNEPTVCELKEPSS